MAPFNIKIGPEGQKNVTIMVSGVLTQTLDRADILTLKDLQHEPKGLRLDSVLFAIQEKMGFQLWWRVGEVYTLILPLESRGTFNFEGMQSLHSPKGLEAISMSSFGWAASEKSFMFILDLVKQ
jgi:hypothetical protein